MRDIINNYPFPNTFKVIELSGKILNLQLNEAQVILTLLIIKSQLIKSF